MIERRTSPEPASEANNQDLLIWALYKLGGSDRFVDVEDIYIECFRLAPARLGWRTRPDIPDYKKCSKALQAVEAKTHRGLLAAQGRYQRRLTAIGVEWCETWATVLEDVYGGGTVVRAAATSGKERMLRELRQHPVFLEWVQTQALTPAWGDVADAFRCTSSSSIDVWSRRLDEMQRIATEVDDEDVVHFVETVTAALTSKGGVL